MNMKTAIVRSLVFPGVLCLLSGCSIFPSPEVTVAQYYDLSIPEKLSTYGKNVEVLPFSSNSGDRYKMVLRNQNRIESTENCKWILPPGSLMTKYLRLAFRSEPGDTRKNGTVILSGSISAFESENDSAILGLTYKLRMTGKTPEKEISRTILLREKFAKTAPEEFAAAMSKAAKKAAESIAADLKKL